MELTEEVVASAEPLIRKPAALVHQLRRTGGQKGVAALCLGGGNAVAMVVEA